jgi:hypothetical protein
MSDVLYFSGLDVGQAQDFTAFAVLERTKVPDPDQAYITDHFAFHYAVRHLERFALGTSYTQLCARLADLFAEPPLRDSVLAVDQTAVGRPVVQMLWRARLRASVQPVAITGGNRALVEGGVRLIPKKELVSTLQLLLQERRLKVSPALPEAATLVCELAEFKIKAPPAGEVPELWREGPHDDLVLAVAIAAWLGERHHEFKIYFF